MKFETFHFIRPGFYMCSMTAELCHPPGGGLVTRRAAVCGPGLTCRFLPLAASLDKTISQLLPMIALMVTNPEIESTPNEKY